MNARRGLRLLKPSPKPVPKPGTWSSLAEPVYPDETALRMRAQSLLSGNPIGQCPPLTLEQARDVLAWFQPRPEILK